MGNGVNSQQSRFVFDQRYCTKILNQLKQQEELIEQTQQIIKNRCDIHQNQFVQAYCLNINCKTVSRKVCQTCLDQNVHRQDVSFKIEQYISCDQLQRAINHIKNYFFQDKLNLIRCQFLIIQLCSQGFENQFNQIQKDLEIFQLQFQEISLEIFLNTQPNSLYDYFLEQDRNLEKIKYQLQNLFTPGGLQTEQNEKKTQMIKQIRENEAFKQKWIDNNYSQQAIQLIESLLEDGKQKMNQRKYEEAIEDFDQIISFCGKLQSQALFQKGVCLYNLERYDEALQQEPKKLENVYFTGIEQCQKKACAQKKLKQYDESLNNFTQAIKMNQNHAQSYYKKVNLYFQLLKYDQIKNFDKEIVGRLKNIDIKNIQGKILFKQKKYQDAISIFNYELQINNYNLFALKQLGKIYYQLSKFDEQQKQYKLNQALQKYQQMLDIDKDNFFANKQIGLVKYEQQQYSSAIQSFNLYIELKGNTPNLIEVKRLKLQSLFNNCNYEESLKYSNQLIIQDPYLALWIKAQSYYQLKEYKNCENAILQLLQQNRVNKDPFHLLGQCYYHLSRYDICIDYLKPIINLYPKSVAILGISYLNQSNHKEAISMFNKAIDQDQNFLGNFIQIERKFCENKCFDESYEMLQKLIQLFPQESLYEQRLGIVEYHRGKYENAIKLMIKYTHIDEYRQEIDIFLGISFYHIQQYREVITFCLQTLSYKHDEVVLFKLLGIKFKETLGLSYFQLRDYQQSQHYLEEMVKIDNTDPQANHYLALSLYIRKEYKAALQIFLNSQQQNIEYLLYQGKCYYYLEQYQDSIDIFNQVLKFDNMNIEAQIFLVQCYYSMENYLKAIKIAEALLKHKDNILVSEIQGLSYYHLQKYNQANFIFDQLISHNQKNHHVLYYKGLTLQKQNNHKDTIELLEKEAYYHLGISLYYVDRYQDSYNAFAKAQGFDPENNEIRIFRLKTSFYNKNYDQVIQICEELIQSLEKEEKHFATAVVMKGITLGIMERNQEALDIIVILITDPLIQIKESNNTELPFDNTFKYKHYQKIAQNILNKDKNNMNALKIMGISCYYLKLYKEAIQCFEKLIQINPEKKECYQHEIQIINQSIQLDPSYIQQFNQKAVILYHDKQYKEAKEIFEKILNSDPQNIIANTYISYILFQQDQIDQAISMIEQILNQYPEYSYALYLKGIILYRQDKYQESLKVFYQLELLEPENLNVKNNIAQIFLIQNNLPSAVQLSHEILKLDPHFAYAQLCLDKSKKINQLKDKQDLNN